MKMIGLDLVLFSDSIIQPGPVQVTQPPCRSSRVKGSSAPVIVPADPSRRKPVHDRVIAKSTPSFQGGGTPLRYAGIAPLLSYSL